MESSDKDPNEQADQASDTSDSIKEPGAGAEAGLNDDADNGASNIDPEPERLSAKKASDINVEALLKVPVSLSIEVGRTQMRLDDLLDTQEGSVIELEKMLDEPLDILVNGALIAHGVIVLAKERFGIQITDILSPEERAMSL